MQEQKLIVVKRFSNNNSDLEYAFEIMLLPSDIIQSLN